MPSLHLIQNQTDPKLLPRPQRPGSDVWIGGYWSLAEAKTGGGGWDCLRLC